MSVSLPHVDPNLDEDEVEFVHLDITRLINRQTRKTIHISSHKIFDTCVRFVVCAATDNSVIVIPQYRHALLAGSTSLWKGY